MVNLRQGTGRAVDDLWQQYPRPREFRPVLRREWALGTQRSEQPSCCRAVAEPCRLCRPQCPCGPVASMEPRSQLIGPWACRQGSQEWALANQRSHHARHFRRNPEAGPAPFSRPITFSHAPERPAFSRPKACRRLPPPFDLPAAGAGPAGPLLLPAKSSGKCQILLGCSGSIMARAAPARYAD